MELVRQSTIFSGSPGTDTANCCFPSIAALDGGGLVVTWRAGSQKDSADGHILLSRSRNGGLTWSTPRRLTFRFNAPGPGEPHYAPVTATGGDNLLAAVMWIDRSEPSLPFFHPATEGLLPVRTPFFESSDAGDTWMAIGEMDNSPYESPMPITAPILTLPARRLACQFEVNKSYRDEKPWRHAAAWKVSSDGGRSWPDHIELANDPTGRFMYWDAHSACREDGLCIAFFWTYDRVECRDVNIHVSHSFDSGLTWTVPRDTGLAGQVAHPVFLEDARLAVVYLDRFFTRSVRVALSDDLGETFHSDYSVYSHTLRGVSDNATTALTNYLVQMDSWTFGRVDAVSLADGKIAVVFYAGTSSATSIRCVIISVTQTAARRIDLPSSHESARQEYVRNGSSPLFGAHSGGVNVPIIANKDAEGG